MKKGLWTNKEVEKAIELAVKPYQQFIKVVRMVFICFVVMLVFAFIVVILR